MWNRNRVARLAAGIALAAVPAAALDVVYVTRHAQKSAAEEWRPIGDLRPLSLKGAACAGRLSQLMEGRGVAKVYATETARTLATGLAVSGSLDGVGIAGDNAMARLTPDQAHSLSERHAEDQAILIVGHSNTVTELVLAFRPDAEACLERLRLTEPGAARHSISEKQYGDVWRLELATGHAACAGITHEHLGQAGEFDCSTP